MDEDTARLLLAAHDHLDGALAGERWARTHATAGQVRAIGEAAQIADDRPEFLDVAVRMLRGIVLFPAVDFGLSRDWSVGFVDGVAVVWSESEEYDRWFDGEPDHIVQHHRET